MSGKHRTDSSKDSRQDSPSNDENGKHDESGRHNSSEKKKKKLGVKAVRSRELRAGVVYYDCDCYHRNGLQQDCPRGGCGGVSNCVTKPWPKCDLSHYFQDKWGKYDELLDLIPPSTYCGPKDALLQSKLGKMQDLQPTGSDDKKDNSSNEGGKTNGKLGKHEDKKYRSKRPDAQRSDEKHGIIDDEERDKVHEKMVQKYAMIPIGGRD